MTSIIKFLMHHFHHLSQKLSVSHILILGFLFIQLIGSVLLWLPISSKNESVDFVNAFFTATSALCVTGLTVKNTLMQWSLFGKVIIMCMIEIGGLGFMTIITIFFIFAGKKITLKERLIIQESLNQLSYSGIVKLVKRISCWVLIMQGIGALILAIRFMFIRNINFFWAIFLGIFHSISSYCNAGFDILGNKSLIEFANDLSVNLTIMILITLGGLGYTVFDDLLHIFKDLSYKKLNLRKKFDRLKLHSKLVIITSVILIFAGAIFFFSYEYFNPYTFGNLNFCEKIQVAFFQSVTSRTAGFFSVDQTQLSTSSKLITIILMFIGGSPGSTAGGIKTIAFAVLFLSIISAVKGKNQIEAFDRTISFQTLQRALTITSLNFLVILFSSLIISSCNINIRFIDILFEITSAVGTVGLGLGISEKVSTFCKIVICIDMMLGKLGPVTLAIALMRNKNSVENLINYPKEKIIV